MIAILAAAVPVAAQASRRPAVLKVSGAEPRALVIVDGIRQGRADQAGTRVVETIPPGKYTVVVRQAGFVDFKQPVTLAPGKTAAVTPKRVPLTDQGELAFQRAESLAVDGKNTDAIAAYREAIAARGSDYPAAQLGLARALVLTKQVDEATAELAKAIDANPRSVEAHTVLGMALRERGLYDEAASEFRKAIAIAPTKSPDAHAGLALALDDAGKREEAVAEFRKSIAQNQDSEPILYQLLGAALEELDRPKEAIAAYERFLALAPSHTLAPAVRSVVERLRVNPGEVDEGDVNPYAPKP